jgi:hypothetical protein
MKMIWLIWVFAVLLSFGILYFIIKSAVRNGIIEARYMIEYANDPNNGYYAGDNFGSEDSGNENSKFENSRIEK